MNQKLPDRIPALEIQVEDLRRLNNLVRRLVPTREPTSLLREVLDSAMKLDGADMGLLSMCDPGREGLRIAASSGFGARFLRMSEFIPPGVGGCGMCYRERQHVIVEDMEQDPRFSDYRTTASAGGFHGVHSTPLMGRGGRIIGVLSVHFRRPHRPSEREIAMLDAYAPHAADCIEYARLLDEATRARDTAERANRTNNNLLALLSYELRVPLNPVLLVASEGAENPRLSDEVREDFSTIAQNVAMESQLIDDLMGLTGIAQGRRPFEMRPLDVHDIVQSALVTVRPEIERKQIALSLGLRAGQQTIMGDAARLRQIFWNVLRNAATFTGDKGVITVETRTLTPRRAIAVTITDSGIGMTAAELESAFNPIAQGDRTDRSRAPPPGGNALGLAHTRILVELHAGHIRATSPGRDLGSSFIIELPLASAAQAADRPSSLGRGPDLAPRPARPGSTGRLRRILLVEDHVPTRTAMAKLLARRHYEVEATGSGAEAVALAGRKEFDLLVADIGLPDADGCELMTTLRERHGLKGIAVTGYGMEQDVARSKAAGFSAHLTKPVSAQTFERALAAVEGR